MEPSQITIPYVPLLNADNKVSQDRVEYLARTAVAAEKILWGKDLIISYKLTSNFTILTKSTCVDPENFDIEVSREVCYKQLLGRLWEFEGYLLKNSLYNPYLKVTESDNG